MRLRKVTALLLCLLSYSFDAFAQGPGSVAAVCPEQIMMGTDGWEMIRAPEFEVGAGSIWHYAVDQLSPETLFVTNETQIMRTTDGGCTFESVFVAERGSGPAGYPRITQLTTSSAQQAGHRVYAVIDDPLTGVEPRVYVSLDAGDTWESVSEGLPSVGRIKELLVSDTNVDVLYALVQLSGDVDAIYSSTNHGASWQIAGVPAVDVGLIDLDNLEEGNVPSIDDTYSFDDITLEPGSAESLWAGSQEGLFHSADGGASWSEVGDLSSVGFVSVHKPPGGLARVVATAYEIVAGNTPVSTGLMVSDDGGTTFSKVLLPEPDGVASVAQDDHSILITMPSGWRGSNLFIYDLGTETWKTANDSTRPAFYDLTSDPFPTTTFYARSTLAIFRSTNPASPPPLKGLGGHFIKGETPSYAEFCSGRSAASGAGSEHDSATLNPKSVTVALSPGLRQRVPYELLLPAAVELDVFFVVDTSGSMGPILDGVAASMGEVATSLAGRGIDARFGVAHYVSYSDHLPYCRLHDLGRDPETVSETLAALEDDGGQQESQLTAVYQAASGVGEQGLIPAGEGASWRDGALRVIIHASDERFGKNYELYGLGPNFDQTAHALQENAVMHIGLSGNDRDATPPLAELSRRSGAIALEPVDCDGDGDIELDAGAPLVCSVVVDRNGERQVPDNLAPQVTGLLEALAIDARDVRLAPVAGKGVVANVTPRSYARVDLHKPRPLSYGVVFECSAGDVGRTVPVELEATTTNGVVATAKAIVICGTPPIQRPRPLIGLGVLPPPPPPPPPVLTGGTAPAQVTAQAPAQVPAHAHAAQAQGALVPQRQEQPQMAFVHAARQLKEQSNLSHAMTARSAQRDPLGAVKFGLGAASITLILAFGYASTLVRAQLARNRRW